MLLVKILGLGCGLGLVSAVVLYRPMLRLQILPVSLDRWA
jgi:hypothetical protein